MFPNAQRLNRGNYVMSQLVHACRVNDVTDLIIIHEHRGEPSECVCVGGRGETQCVGWVNPVSVWGAWVEGEFLR